MIRTHFFKEEEETKKAPVTFHSQGGQKRLIKIWNDQNLSAESVFSSFISRHSNETALRESVNDYMQNYLRLRQQRYSIKNASHYIYEVLHKNNSSNYKKNEDNKKFQTYYYLHQRKCKEEAELKERIKKRCVQEEEKISNLNKQKDFSNNNLPNQYIDNNNNNNNIIVKVLQETPAKNELLPIPNSNDVVVESRSSGFDDEPSTPPVPSPVTMISIDSEDSLYEDFDTEDVTKHLTFDRESLEECDIDDETKLALILLDEVDFHWTSPIIQENIFKEKDLLVMYDVAEKIRRFYLRQIYVATEFANELGIFMNSKI